FDYESFDWDRVYKKSIQWRIAPLLYKILEKRIKSSLKNCPPLEGAGGGQPSIPKHFLEKIKVKYLITCVANNAIYKDLAEISEVFSKAGIQFILLKGSHLAKFVYQDPGMRPMGDIDILVKKDDLQKAEELLLQMGYYQEHDKIGAFHLPYFLHQKRVKSLEVHWTIASSIWKFNINIEGLWERVKAVRNNGSEMLVFSSEDLLLYLSLHAVYQHNLKAFGLIPYCDIASTIHRFAHGIDWDQLKQRAHEWGIEKYLYLALRISHEMLGVCVPDHISCATQSEPLNETIVSEAINRILSIKAEKATYTDIPHLFYEDFHPSKSLMKRMLFAFRRVFISPEKLAACYKLPTNSLLVYLYYFVRFITLIYRYFILHYAYLILYKLNYKKEPVYGEKLDLWLLLPDSKK
ncbi:MAG: nucleotidyltransferase family protein, partial [Bacteroidia bacterium]|nr:nucleotidyltransferase family protein [Bacteroidia bacterium]